LQTIILDGKAIAPSKLVCVGRNYVEHINELDNEVPEEMVVFLKPNSAIGKEVNAFHQEDLHYEAELCFVYQEGRFGAVGFGLDLTKRALQSKLKAKGLPWERAKAFDGSAVLSEFVSIEKIEQSMTLELRINDKLIQQGGIELMIYKPDEILAQIQSFMTLEDGDVVMTGTPKGVGKVESGAKFQGKVLSNNRELISAYWQVK